MPAPAQISSTSGSTAAAVTLAARSRLRGWSRLREIAQRLVRPLMLLLAVFLVGTAGYFIIGAGSFSLLDCVYMTSITLTTVGYGEVVAIQEHAARNTLVVWTIGLMWVGMGVTLYAISAVTTFLVEHNLQFLIKGRKMLKEIESLKGHVILCGLGRTGTHVARELLHARQPFVVIEHSEAAIEHWKAVHEELSENLLYVVGDASDEYILERAGIQRARGLVTTLTTDAENMLVVVSSKYIHPELRVLTKVVDTQFSEKLRRAGADGVVSPSFIGGMRLASEMIRPHVVNFLDDMLRSTAGDTRITEIQVPPHSRLQGFALRKARILEKTGLLVIAVRNPDGSYVYNPGPELELEIGMVLVVIGAPDAVEELRTMVAVRHGS